MRYARKDEGASHLARRGKNAEAFLNLQCGIVLSEKTGIALRAYFPDDNMSSAR